MRLPDPAGNGVVPSGRYLGAFPTNFPPLRRGRGGKCECFRGDLCPVKLVSSKKVSKPPVKPRVMVREALGFARRNNGVFPANSEPVQMCRDRAEPTKKLTYQSVSDAPRA